MTQLNFFKATKPPTNIQGLEHRREYITIEEEKNS